MEQFSVLEEDQISNEDKTIRKRRKYTVEFKCYIIKMYDNNGKNASLCERSTGIDRRLIGEWLLKREALETARKKREIHRVPINRQCEWPELENTLFEWISDQRSNNCAVSGTVIRQKALSIYEQERGYNQPVGGLSSKSIRLIESGYNQQVDCYT